MEGDGTVLCFFDVDSMVFCLGWILISFLGCGDCFHVGRFFSCTPLCCSFDDYFYLYDIFTYQKRYFFYGQAET